MTTERNPIIDDDLCTPFPQRLMEILSNEEYSDVITWIPDGKKFVIAKKKKFASDILPLYFKSSSKWTSFTRKLNRWGFTRITSGPENGAYCHEFFVRDDPRLCHQMHCESGPKFTMMTQQQQAPPVQPQTSNLPAPTAPGNLYKQQLQALIEKERSKTLNLYLQLLQTKNLGSLQQQMTMQPDLLQSRQNTKATTARPGGVRRANAA